MINYFLDCGSHFGEGLECFIEKYNMNEKWKVFSFEPNKKSFQILSNKKFKVNVEFLNKGVSDNNNLIKFRPETTSESYGGNSDGAGSTFISEDDWNIKTSGNPGAGSYNEFYDVECIDLDEFINSLPNIQKLIVKLDVEGCEYKILRKLLQTGTIKKINELYVEFHDWAMSSETRETTNIIIKDVENLGIKFYNWG